MKEKIEEIKDKVAELTDVEAQATNMVNKGKSLVQKLKELGLGAIACLGFSWLAQMFLPWWVICPVCMYVGWFVYDDAKRSFAYGFLALSLLWGVYANILNAADLGATAGQVAALFSKTLKMSITSSTLVYITGVIGGLVGGLSAMSGSLMRQLFIRS